LLAVGYKSQTGRGGGMEIRRGQRSTGPAEDVSYKEFPRRSQNIVLNRTFSIRSNPSLLGDRQVLGFTEAIANAQTQQSV